jgi:hypothetical protein
MKSSLFLIAALLLAQVKQVPKHDPNGIWESDTGTKFAMKLDDESRLAVRLVAGSNAVYVNYDVDLRANGDENAYEGSGFFVARLKDKECRFDTKWNIIVVQPDLIAGLVSHVVPEAGTCEVKERRDELIQLKRVK